MTGFVTGSQYDRIELQYMGSGMFDVTDFSGGGFDAD